MCSVSVLPLSVSPVSVLGVKLYMGITWLCCLLFKWCPRKSDEAIQLFKRAPQVMKDSNYLSPDDSIMEKMRVDLAELLHTVGR